MNSKVLEFAGRVALFDLIALALQFFPVLPQIFIPTKGDLIFDTIVNTIFLSLFSDKFSKHKNAIKRRGPSA